MGSPTYKKILKGLAALLLFVVSGCGGFACGLALSPSTFCQPTPVKCGFKPPVRFAPPASRSWWVAFGKLAAVSPPRSGHASGDTATKKFDIGSGLKKRNIRKSD